ncbi:MAG: SDR family NAD(P)-dependent oxidoreductase [Gammaproteobacteria bacterium]|nr:SDR family NAD(P)-dependent oxidoreductase [Gammaproteobacteria bacterium]
MGKLKGKVAFVTGGGSGIGRGIAKTFLEQGIKVAIGDIREDSLKRVSDELGETYDNLISIQCDVSRHEDLVRAASEIEQQFGNIHIVCNNAGIGGRVGHFPRSDLGAWKQLIDVNLWGVVLGCRVFAERMIAHGEGGHIVNTSSIGGLCTFGDSTAYCTTKFGVTGLSGCLKEELAPHNIGVSVLCPYVIDTPIYYPDIDPTDEEAVRERVAQMDILKEALHRDFAGEMVLRGIIHNEPYIFCDDRETSHYIEKMYSEMKASMERQKKYF